MLPVLTVRQCYSQRTVLLKHISGISSIKSRQFSGWSRHTIRPTALFSKPTHFTLSHPRWISKSSRASYSASEVTQVVSKPINESSAYYGPLTQTFRRLKLFSLGSLGLTFAIAPFLFIVESSLPASARVILAATAIGTSGISTALIGWVGAPYVVELRRLKPAENNGIVGVEMTTLTLALKKLTTRVYDADFLVDTRRPFAHWELAYEVQLPPPSEDATLASKAGSPGDEETVAETLDHRGKVVGRWIVKWGEGGVGTCQAHGKVLR